MKRNAFLGMVAVCILAWTACDPSGEQTQCQADMDCPGLQVCIDRVCTEPGSTDEQNGDATETGDETNDSSGDATGDGTGEGSGSDGGDSDAGASGTSEQICDDGIDNDRDGLTDCDDTADCTCHQEAQDPCGAVPVRCGDVVQDTTVGGTNRIDVHTGCSQWDDTGPERIYLVEDVRPGTLHADLVEMQEGMDLDIFVHEDGCAPETCKEMGSHEAWCGVDPDKAYYIIVDGYEGDAGTFTLEVNCLGEDEGDTGPCIEGVPYFYQYHNDINPGGSCQNTSMAMVLKFYGATSETPDAISSNYGTSQAQSVAGFQQVFNSEASYFGLSVRDRGTTGGSLQQVRNLLAQGKPVVVHGYFTGYGHVIVLLGYDGTHYCAHDPAGVWNEVFQGGGYTGYDPQGGRYVRYRKAALEQAIAPDGLVWMHEPMP